MIDLQAIFGDAPMGIGPDPEPQASDNAPALEEKAGNPTATVDAPKPAPAPSGEPNAGRVPFPDWVLRPDATGRLGWEPPGLPESRRWWACCTDDELPTWDDLLHGRVTIGRWAGGALYVRTSDGPDGPTGTHAGLAACSWCGRRQWWRSQAWPDVVRCGWCSPPVPGLPVEWLDRSEAGPIEKPVTQEAGCCVSAGSVNV